MMLAWIIMIVVAAITGEWSLLICCLIAMAFFVKAQAQ
jgi:hypothetical protein